MPVRRAGQSYRRTFSKSSHNQGYHGQGQNQPGSLRKSTLIDPSTLRTSEATSANEKAEATQLAHSIDESMGFLRYESGKRKIGWLCNMHSTTVEDDKIPGGRAGVDFYFIGEEEGDTFKATVEHDPYFLVAVKRKREAEVEEWCRRTFEGLVKGIKRIEKEDLQMVRKVDGIYFPIIRSNAVYLLDDIKLTFCGHVLAEPPTWLQKDPSETHICQRQ